MYYLGVLPECIIWVYYLGVLPGCITWLILSFVFICTPLAFFLDGLNLVFAPSNLCHVPTISNVWLRLNLQTTALMFLNWGGFANFQLKDLVITEIMVSQFQFHANILDALFQTHVLVGKFPRWNFQRILRIALAIFPKIFPVTSELSFGS